MRKILWPLLIGAALLLSGCGSNDFDEPGKGNDNNGTNTETTADGNITSGQDANTSKGLKIELPIEKVVITQAGSSKKIIARVTENGFGVKGKTVVIKKMPDKGSLSPQEITTDEAGDATFTYRAPASLEEKTMTVTFCLKEKESLCKNLTLVLTQDASNIDDAVDNINYSIQFHLSNQANNLALGSKENAIVTLIDKDTNETIPADRIESFTISSRDANILKITPESGGTPVSTISYAAKQNPVTVLLNADRINSGLAILEVTVKYTNKNGISKTRGQLFAIAVLSGEPTAFSINSDGVTYNFDTKQFEHKFIIQAVDNAGNRISSPGVINISVMASFAKDNTGKEILYGRYEKDNNGISATLNPASGSAEIILSGAAPFSEYDDSTGLGIKKQRAMVAVFGDVETYEANGKWNLKEIVSGDKLLFSNEYHGDNHAGLGMAVGYNYRDKICSNTYEEAVVYVDANDGKYSLDKDGKAIVVIKHDAYMIGKRIMLMVNMTGLNPGSDRILRSGEVHETTLAFHLPLKGKTINIPKGQTIDAYITGVIDTGTGDEYSVRNSTFSCEIELNNAKIVNGPFKNDPNDCGQERAFLGYKVTTVDTAKDGSITFKRCQVDAEKRF